MKNPSKANRIVIKLGTKVVMQDNKFNRTFVKNLAAEISKFRRRGKEFIIITSGAIGLGLEKLNMNYSSVMEFQQAAAAIGQNLLMHNYEKTFSNYNQVIAQLLLTRDDFTSKKSSRILRRTIGKLLSMNVIPIINENDPVAVEELKTSRGFSDNDVLAAMVAVNLNADLLIVVSDVDGLYSDDPNRNARAVQISEVKDFRRLNSLIKGKSHIGRGGFKTKIEAAKLTTNKGIPAIVCKARKGIIAEVFSGKRFGTLFLPGK